MIGKQPYTYQKGHVWYWSPGPRDRKLGCKFGTIRLGEDFLDAMQQARKINEDLKAWRAALIASNDGGRVWVPGTLGWMFEEYFQSSAAAKLRAKGSRTISDYEYYFSRYARRNLKNGRPLLSKKLDSFTARAADSLYQRFEVDHGQSSANKLMRFGALAWDQCERLNPDIMPRINHLRGVTLHTDQEAETIPASYDELMSFVSACIKHGEVGIAIIARLAWDMHMRPSQAVATPMADWRPDDEPHGLMMRSEKTARKSRRVRQEVQPLDDRDEATGEWISLFPELDSLVSMLPSARDLLVMRERRHGARVFKGEWEAIKTPARIAARIRQSAGLGEHVTLAGFRHGGITEMGSSGIPTSLMQARSLHRNRRTLEAYDHSSTGKRLEAQRLRLAARDGERVSSDTGAQPIDNPVREPNKNGQKGH
jgi:hypothetical protein